MPGGDGVTATERALTEAAGRIITDVLDVTPCAA
jgi:ribosomal protein S11